MARNVELYINDIKADFYGDENIELTDSIQNIRDIGKVFTSFTKQFTLPASKTNNNIFKHYYNANIVDGFDARYKIDAEIKIDGFNFKKGSIKLNSVSLKDNHPSSYKVVFFGNLAQLNTMLGEDLLEELDFLYNFGIKYNYTNIKTYLANGFDKTVNGEVFTDALKVPLITHTQRLFYDSSESPVTQNNIFNSGTNPTGVAYTELKPSLRLWVIIRAIEEKYGITFSDDFFSVTNPNFYDLYMWLHRSKGDVYERTEGLLTDTVNTLPTTSWNGAIFTPSSFTLNDIFTFGASRYRMDVSINATASSKYSLSILKGSQVLFKTSEITGTGASVQIITDFDLVSNGTYNIEIESSNPITISGNINLQREHYYDATANQNFSIGSFSLLSDYAFVVNKQIPKMKVIDFLSALFKMFNLTAYVDNEGIIVVKTLNDFYAAGIDYELTTRLDISESEISSGILFEQVDFNYKGVGSLQAEKHNNLFKYDWGATDYSANDQIEGTVYKIEIPFEHMKHERLFDLSTNTPTGIQWGWMTDSLNEDGSASPYIGLPLIHYLPLQTSVSFRINNGTSYDNQTSFYLPSNSIALTDSFNINFNAEVNEYGLQVYESTLFQTYYKDYIEDIFDYKRRVYTYTVYLPINFTLNYNMSDRIIIGGRRYKINSIELNVNTGKSTLELINDI